MNWGHTLPKEKPWPNSISIVSVARDPGWKNLSYPKGGLTPEQITKRLKAGKR